MLNDLINSDIQRKKIPTLDVIKKIESGLCILKDYIDLEGCKHKKEKEKINHTLNRMHSDWRKLEGLIREC